MRERYSIRSGLLPSLHFLDADGRPIASLPPMGEDELAFFLDSTPLTADEGAAPAAGETPLLEVRADVLSNRCGRLLLDRYDRGERRLPAVHKDVDFADLAFFAELSGVRLRRRSLSRLESDCALLLESDLYDPVSGGVHRSVALSDGAAVHREMVLRQNAEAGAVMAAWFRRTGRATSGPAAANFVRLLNDSFRRGMHAIYAGSLSADLYDEAGELALPGERYYRRDAAGRRMAGTPVPSDDAPAGGNYVVQEMLLQVFRTWGDDRMRKAISDRGPLLRA
ncbi:hypothetical protein K8I85_03130, partial [bacterium]|nr:hypothetical protein [bacterium]